MGHVWLIGMMGSGKTTVGRVLAGRLDLPFVDLDAVIETRAGRSVDLIFAEDGEGSFRREERAAVAAAARGERSVIAAGGGTVLDSGNVDVMHESGEVVLLEARADVLVERLRADETVRPLLGQDDLDGRVAALLAARRDAYRAAADRIVDAAQRSADDIAAEIASR